MAKKKRSSRWSDWEVWYRPLTSFGKPFRLYMTTSTRQNAAAIRDRLQREGNLVELREHR